MLPPQQRATRGFSLVELLIALAVALIVIGALYPVSRAGSLVQRSEVARGERGETALRALDDIAFELTRAGFGLGDGVPRVVPGRPGQPLATDSITVRSNPAGIAGRLRADLTPGQGRVPVAGANGFGAGERVLLADVRRQLERAEVDRVQRDELDLRFPEDSGGRLRRPFRVERASRVVKVREAVFFLRDSPLEGERVLVKQVDGAAEQVLARGVGELRFEYLDRAGETIALRRVTVSPQLALVRTRLALVLPAPAPSEPRPFLPPLTTAVALEPQSATVGFDEPGRRFRLVRYFWPISNAVGVASRPLADEAVILTAGPTPVTGPGALYKFIAQPGFLDVRVDSLVSLDPVRYALQPLFAPEEGALAGSLFVVAGSTRSVEVWRVLADELGEISPHSDLEQMARLREMQGVGGAALGIDDALYLTDPAGGAVFRFHPEAADAKRGGVERIATIGEEPGPIASAPSGSLYFLARRVSLGDERTTVWELPFDEALSPLAPRAVGLLPGEPRSLALDPTTGSLHALQREPLGDDVLFELSSDWLRQPRGRPRESFRLSRWKREYERDVPKPDDVVLPGRAFPPGIDFVTFDSFGSAYLGAAKINMVLKCELERPEGTAYHFVGVAGVVEEEAGSARKKLRLHAWRKATSGL
jgi:prepilin-type N-terminal cleavage/methylation domain-containing protein